MKSPSELDDLRLFLEVAESGSFTRAAERLELPASTLSRRLKALEDAVGAALLLRSTRRIVLTEAGERLRASVAGPLSLVEDGLAEARSGSGALRGRLRISTSVTFALTFLPAILQRYAAVCPEVSVEVLTGHGNVDLVGEGVDVALRMGRPADSDFVYRRFGRVAQRLYASPALARALLAEHPRDLAAAPIVTHRRRLRHGQVHWSLTKGEEEYVLTSRAAVVLDDPSIVERVVAASLGVGMLNDEVARKSASEGALQMLLGDWQGPVTDLYYLHHPQPRVSPKVRHFLEAVRSSRDPSIRLG